MIRKRYNNVTVKILLSIRYKSKLKPTKGRTSTQTYFNTKLNICALRAVFLAGNFARTAETFQYYKETKPILSSSTSKTASRTCQINLALFIVTSPVSELCLAISASSSVELGSLLSADFEFILLENCVSFVLKQLFWIQSVRQN